MSNKLKKMCSITLVFKEIETKTRRTYHFKPTKMTKMKKITSDDEEKEKSKL